MLFSALFNFTLFYTILLYYCYKFILIFLLSWVNKMSTTFIVVAHFSLCRLLCEIFLFYLTKKKIMKEFFFFTGPKMFVWKMIQRVKDREKGWHGRIGLCCVFMKNEKRKRICFLLCPFLEFFLLLIPCNNFFWMLFFSLIYV